MFKYKMNSRREGFALPMAIMLLGFLTAGLVAAFMRQSSERSIVSSTSSQTNAFAVAEAGLEAFIAQGDTTASASYTFSKGTATVTATRIKAAVVAARDTSIWLVRSTGVALGGTRTNPAARRTVAQLAYRAPVQMQVLSSWTSLSGIDKNGNSGSVAGADACGVASAKAGASVPDAMLTGHQGPFSGNPAIDYMGTKAEMAAAIKIDWAGIISPTSPALSADIVVCKAGTYGYNADLGPCGNFPAQADFTATYWPTIIINGSSSLPADGHGLLIVTGNLTLGGGDVWDGIIMVGGIVTDNGNGGIGGTVITGLNIKLGEDVPQSSKANGTKDYNFDSCKIAKATNGMTKLSAVKNAWMDNWSAW